MSLMDYGIRFNEIVSGELRAQKARRKITVAELAKATGRSRTAVMHYLNAQRDIPMPVFYLLCDALGLTPGAVLDDAHRTLNDL